MEREIFIFMWPETKKYLQLNPTFNGMRHSGQKIKILGINNRRDGLDAKRIVDYIFRRFNVSAKSGNDGSIYLIKDANIHFMIEFLKRNIVELNYLDKKIKNSQLSQNEIAALFILAKYDPPKNEYLKLLIEKGKFSIINDIWKNYGLCPIYIDNMELLFSTKDEYDFFIDYVEKMDENEFISYVETKGLPDLSTGIIKYQTARILMKRFPKTYIINKKILEQFVSKLTFYAPFLRELVPGAAQRMSLKQFLRIIRNWWFDVEKIDGEIYVSKYAYRFKLCWPKKLMDKPSYIK